LRFGNAIVHFSTMRIIIQGDQRPPTEGYEVVGGTCDLALEGCRFKHKKKPSARNTHSTMILLILAPNLNVLSIHSLKITARTAAAD
jgi:hypothetical protein